MTTVRWWVSVRDLLTLLPFKCSWLYKGDRQMNSKLTSGPCRRQRTQQGGGRQGEADVVAVMVLSLLLNSPKRPPATAQSLGVGTGGRV